MADEPRETEQQKHTKCWRVLVRQGVPDVVDAAANAERGILLSSFLADKGRAVYETLTLAFNSAGATAPYAILSVLDIWRQGQPRQAGWFKLCSKMIHPTAWSINMLLSSAKAD